MGGWMLSISTECFKHLAVTLGDFFTSVSSSSFAVYGDLCSKADSSSNTGPLSVYHWYKVCLSGDGSLSNLFTLHLPVNVSKTPGLPTPDTIIVFPMFEQHHVLTPTTKKSIIGMIIIKSIFFSWILSFSFSFFTFSSSNILNKALNKAWCSMHQKQVTQ